MEHDRLIPQQSASVGTPSITRGELQPVSANEARISAQASEDTISQVPSQDDHTTADSYGGEIRTDTTQHGTEKAKVPTASLRRSGHVLYLVLLYSTLAVFSWVVLCILTKRPITATRHYGVNFDEPHAYGWTGANVIHSFYTKNEKWLRAAQVLQSIVAVLTIPLTSAVCSKAAVAYCQRRSHRKLSLRQTMVLADRGWTDPIIYLRMLAGGFKKYGTTFLLGAALLNIIGGIVAPLQAYFMTTETIKTPTFPDMLTQIADIADFFKYTEHGIEDNHVTVLARAALASAADGTSPQARLWTEHAINCTEGLTKADSKALPLSCVYGAGNTLQNITALPGPFLAELPSQYSTGVIRQYTLRINSTAHREIVTEADYPADCASLPDAFYTRFGSNNPNLVVMTGWGNWSLEACMPANLTTSPWRATRKRQDFAEELYLNISLTAAGSTEWFDTPQEQGGLFKITLDTTAGYFELPNYMNGQQPGPLLDESPTTLCGGNCSQQANLVLYPQDLDG